MFEAIIVGILVLLIGGAAYQFVSSLIDRRTFPPTGELIDIGGRKLHVVCATKFMDKPTVILEAGNGLTSTSWALVQADIAKFANCISYDRAGFGYSDPRNDSYTSLNDVGDLHKLTKKLHLNKPFILVGHSYGGMLSRLYASMHAEEVAGVVLVDAYHEEQMNIIPLPSRTMMNCFRILTLFGVFRLFSRKLFPIPSSLPHSMRKRLYAELTSYSWTKTTGEIFANVEESLQPIKSLPIIDKPVTVISAGLHRGYELKFKERIRELQKNLVDKSTHGKQIIAEGSFHNIPFSEPEIIVSAVRDMVHSLR